MDERIDAFDGRPSARGDGAAPSAAVPRLSPQEVKAAIRDGRELALLDVRDEGVFARAHLLFAAPAPLSRLELVVDRLVPRRSARIVLTDEGEDLVHRAAGKLAGWGYRDVSVLRGGIAAWRDAGYELFSGVHVPSKAFGEIVEHELGTPRLEAQDIKALREQGTDLVVLDSRPIEEFRVMSIPGGLDCPGAELVHRVNEVVRSPDTLVVVNCAGRTRSIIGAQSLINAGVRNRVVALKDGTMGWHLAGLPLAHGETRVAPPPSAEALARSQTQAQAFATRAGVTTITHADLARFRDEADRRSLFVLDVRSPEEYASGHLPGSRSAPGGQLVQSTDLYVGTLNARIVLVDREGVRAPMTASWLVQLGWPEVHVLDGLGTGELEIGPEPLRVQPGRGTDPAWVDPHTLHDLLGRDAAVVIDVDNSLQFRKRHIPGAWFATRRRLSELLGRVPAEAAIVLASRDGVLATLAAEDLADSGREVRVLLGGTAAWIAAELPLEDGSEDRVIGIGEDVWYKPYDWTTDQEAHMREYLSWEVGLVGQIERDGDARFRIVHPDDDVGRAA
jgi:rhodanese-related sulfurtransferase